METEPSTQGKDEILQNLHSFDFLDSIIKIRLLDRYCIVYRKQ